MATQIARMPRLEIERQADTLIAKRRAWNAGCSTLEAQAVDLAAYEVGLRDAIYMMSCAGLVAEYQK